MSRSGDGHNCSMCDEPARRVFTPIAFLGREKPGSFRQDRGVMDGWMDRVATLRNIELTKGDRALKEFRKNCGETLYHKTLAYRKANYA